VLQVWNNGVQALNEPFMLTHDPTGFMGITSPTDPNQLFQMTQQTYTLSQTVPFSAGTSTGGSISWTATPHYQTHGGFGGPDPAPRTFSTTDGVEHDETYQSMGGQVKVIARGTADVGTVEDCVTFYVEGPESGIPDPTITAQLDSLYQASRSYPAGGTPNLMTGVAQHESSYHHFLSPANGLNEDLFDLYAKFNILARWPFESCDGSPATCQIGGSHIGLMQVGTTTADAWNWLTNAGDAVNLFSGNPIPNKLEQAITYENNIRNGYKQGNIKCPARKPTPPPALTSVQRENNALVLYRVAMPAGYCAKLDALYYKAVCSTTTTTDNQGNLVCQNGGTWSWAVNNTGQPTGVAYVSSTTNPLGVRQLLQ